MGLLLLFILNAAIGAEFNCVKSAARFLHKSDSSLQLSAPVRVSASQSTSALHKPDELISNWIDTLWKTHIRHRDNPSVMNRLYRYYFNRYTIKEGEIPESYFNFQRRLAREQGHGDIEITEDMRAELSSNLIKDQEESIRAWLDYFFSKDTDMYPMWIKYWAFNGALKLSKWDATLLKFSRRDKIDVNPFPELNREALAYVVDAVLKHVNGESLDALADPKLIERLKSAQFGSLYDHSMRKILSTKNNLAITKGTWVKYDKGADHMPLVNSLVGKGTGWCTAGESTAANQIARGDFYVYYSLDETGTPTVPRVAIRMEEDRIAEVRGIGKDQNIDPFIAKSGVVEKKLHQFGSEADRYKKSSSDMKLLTEIEGKNKKGEELSESDLRFLYEIDGEISGFGYQKDPRIEEIKGQREIHRDLATIFKVMDSEIGITKEEALRGGIKVYYGDLQISAAELQVQSELPEVVIGSISLADLKSADGIKLPRKVKGLFLDNLETSDGLVLPQEAEYLRLELLTSAVGLKFPHKVKTLDLTNLQTQEGLVLPDEVEKLLLNSLTSVDRVKFPRKVKMMNLFNLENGKGLVLPDEVETLNLPSLKSVNGVKFPRKITKLNLNNLESAGGIVFPEEVESLDLRSLKSAKGAKLPRKVNYLNIGSLESPSGLVLPEEVETLNLSSLKSIKGAKLPRKTENLYLGNLETPDGLILPFQVNVLDLGSLKSAKGIKFPPKLLKLDLSGLKSADGLDLPLDVDVLNFPPLLISKYKVKLPTNLRIINGAPFYP